jgi:hypothetical protein
MAIKGDAFERRVFTLRMREKRWQVMDGEKMLADCQDYDMASAAAARLAREAFNDGVHVRIARE